MSVKLYDKDGKSIAVNEKVIDKYKAKGYGETQKDATKTTKEIRAAEPREKDNDKPSRSSLGGALGNVTQNRSLGNISPDSFRTTQARSTMSNPDDPYNRSSLRGASDLASLYGITYDENAIKGKYDQATKDEYALKNQEYAQTEGRFYNNLYNTGATALDTIRKSNAAAVATGASRGMQAANELSSILGLQQTANTEATTLAQERNNLKAQEAAAYSTNAKDALTYSNQVKQALGTLGSNIYASDAQYDIGKMNYYAQLDAAAKQLEGMQAQAGANVTASENSARGQVDSARINSAGNLASTGVNSLSNLLGNIFTAGTNRLNNQDTLASNERIASQSNTTQQKYYEQMLANAKNYGSGGGYSNGSSAAQNNTISAMLQDALQTNNKAAFVAMLVQSGMDTKDATAMWNERKSTASSVRSGGVESTLGSYSGVSMSPEQRDALIKKFNDLVKK